MRVSKQILNILKMSGASVLGTSIASGYKPFSTSDKPVFSVRAEPAVRVDSKIYIHPTDFVYGLLSSHSYEEALSQDAVVFKEDSKKKYNGYLKSWKVFNIVEDKSSGYCGIIYINDEAKQIVLAHRGTAFRIADLLKKDSPLKTDLRGIVEGKLVPQQTEAYKATELAVTCAEDKAYHLSFTGHSLGAWLAEQSLYFYSSDSRAKELRWVKAVTFDSPGSHKTLKHFKSNIVNNQTSSRHDVTNLDIVTYLSKPNLINVCNKHVGKVYTLAVEPPTPEWISRAIGEIERNPLTEGYIYKQILANRFILDGILSISGHSIDLMLEQFNPESGKPKDGAVAQVEDWPCLECNVSNQSKFDGWWVKKVLGITELSPIAQGLISSAASKVETTTIASVLLNLEEILSGVVRADQYWSTFRNIGSTDKGISNTASAPGQKEVYGIKEAVIDYRKEFELKYRGHYDITPYNPYQDMLSIKKYDTDYYLKQIYQMTPSAIGEKLGWWDEIGQKVLDLKEALKEVTIDGKGNISSYSITIEELRDRVREIIIKFKEEHPDKSIDNVFSIRDTIKAEEGNRIGGVTTHIPLDRLKKKFVEREEDIFSQIKKKLISDQERILAISAPAGTGKTALVKEYAYREKDKETKIIWFKADSKENIRAEYHNFACSLGVKEADREMMIRLVNSQLVKEKSKILLIFDNLEDYKDIKEYVRDLPSNVKVLITTRDNNLEEDVPSIVLRPFSKAEATTYVKKAVKKRVTEEEIREILEKVNIEGNILPYHLEKAVAYINKQPLVQPIKQVVREINLEEDYLFKTVNKQELEWKILQYAAYLDPDNIGIELLSNLLEVEGGALEEPLRKLKRISLITDVEGSEEKAKEEKLLVHRLTQELIKKYIEKENAAGKEKEIIPPDQIQEKILKGLSELFPVGRSSMDEKWKQAAKLLPHVLKSIAFEIVGVPTKNSYEFKAKLYNKLCKYYANVLNDFSQGIKFGEEALNMYKEIHKDVNNLDIATTLKELGTIYIPIELSKAQEYLEKALEMYKKIHKDSNNLDIAATLKELGTVYIHIELSKAQKYLEEGLKMYKEIHKDVKNLDIAATLMVIGLVYKNQGEHVKAQEYLEKGLEMYKELHKDVNNLDIALSLRRLACFYIETEQEHVKAQEYLEQALEIYKKVYIDGKHRDIYTTYNIIGILYKNQGELSKAQKYLEEGLKMYKELPESKHAQIAAALSSLGEVYHAQRELSKAQKYLEEGLKMYKEVYKQNTQDISQTLVELGKVYRELGDDNKSVELFKQAYHSLPSENKLRLELKAKLQNLSPEFLEVEETRIPIIKHGGFDKMHYEIKQVIQQEILNKVYYLARENKWTKPWFTFGDWGIKGYLDEKYLGKKVGNDSERLEIAKMLIFEAINLGIMNNTERNIDCVKNFIRFYPELLDRLVQLHPEYFVDGSIIKELCSETQQEELLGIKYKSDTRLTAIDSTETSGQESDVTDGSTSTDGEGIISDSTTSSEVKLIGDNETGGSI